MFGVRDAKKASARRRLFQLAGTKAAVIQWEQMLVQIVHKAVDKIKRDAKTSSADIFKWWQMMTLDVLGEIAFAESFKVLEMEQVGYMTLLHCQEKSRAEPSLVTEARTGARY